MRTAALIAAVALAGAVSACGGSGQESAATFLHRVTVEFSRGQSGRLWADLVPAEQAVVGRDRYIACQKNTGFRLRSFKVVDRYDEDVDVDGKQTPSSAVTVQVTSDDGVTTATLHAVSVGGRWRWLLQPSDLAAYRAGRCPRR